MSPDARQAIPYLPDGVCDQPPPREPYPLWASLVIFVGTFFVLQWAWTHARDTWIERIVIHEATVKPAARLVRMLTPAVDARAVAASIKAPGGGLNILNGCEGTEVMFLLIAAFMAVRMGGWHKLIGLGLGLILVFALNQARILTLFYAFRNERSLFDMLHTTILPAVLVSAVVLYFYVVLHRGRLA